MKVIPMKAERRTATGRNQLSHIRKEGWMPAVLYGAGKENVTIAISEWELDQHVKARQKVFEIDIDGNTEPAFLQEIAWHTLNDRPLHADFIRIDLDKPIVTELEVTLLGYAAGLSKGGTLVKDSVVIKLRSLPANTPSELEADVTKLNIDDFLRAGELTLPEGVELLSPEDMPICHVIGPRGRKLGDELPGEGEGEGDGEGGEGDGDGEGGGEGGAS